MPSPSQELRAGGSANRLDEKTIEARTLPCEAINMRRARRRVPIDTEIAPALVIGKNNHHIGRRFVGLGGKQQPDGKKCHCFAPETERFG
jgi:hypothetical protein